MSNNLTYRYQNFITGYQSQNTFSPNWSWKYGKNPYYFDGHHHFHIEHVDYNPDLINIGDSWALCLAVKTDIQGINDYHIGKCFVEKRNRSDNGQWDFHVGLTINGNLKVFISPEEDSILGRNIIGSTVINDNKWHHIVIRRNKKNLDIWIDGNVEETNWYTLQNQLTTSKSFPFNFFSTGTDEILFAATRIDRNSVDYYTRTWIRKPEIYLLQNDLTDQSLLKVYQEFQIFNRTANFWEWSFFHGIASLDSQLYVDLNGIDNQNNFLANYNYQYFADNTDKITKWTTKFGIKLSNTLTTDQSVLLTKKNQISELSFNQSHQLSRIIIPNITTIDEVRTYINQNSSIQIQWSVPRKLTASNHLRYIHNNSILWNFNNSNPNSNFNYLPLWTYLPSQNEIMIINDGNTDFSVQIPLKEYSYDGLFSEIQKSLDNLNTGSPVTLSYEIDVSANNIAYISMQLQGATIVFNNLFAVDFRAEYLSSNKIVISEPGASSFSLTVPDNIYNRDNLISTLQSLIDPEGNLGVVSISEDIGNENFIQVNIISSLNNQNVRVNLDLSGVIITNGMINLTGAGINQFPIFSNIKLSLIISMILLFIWKNVSMIY